MSEQSTAEQAASLADVELPLNTYREAAAHLRRPFTEHAIRFKVQATWPKATPANALIVSYIDARLVIDRLNLVVPHLWSDDYSALGANHMVCRLTVDEITRQDVGEGKGKALYSDALKRAAVKFGIGVSVYAVPKIVLSKQGHGGALKDVETKQGKSLGLTEAGEKLCRDRYGAWLIDKGIDAFGPPLEHGDVADSQGDIDAEREDDAADDGGTITAAIAKTVVSKAKAAGKLDRLQLAASHVHGADVGDCSTDAKAVKALRALSTGEADRLLDRLDALTGGAA